MKMGLLWMLLVLLSCSFSQATPSKCSCGDVSIVHFVPEKGSIQVLVPCPNVSGVDLDFFLHKDEEQIYNYTSTQEISHGRLDVKLDKNEENQTVGFILTKVTTESHGIYVCKIARTYPPPYTQQSGQRILLLDERLRFQSSQHNCNNFTEERQDVSREIQSFPWIWMTAVALLSIYSLVVSVLALVSWTKLRKTDCQSDYINTKPRAPRGNKKKRGVQNPIPRYF